MSQVFISYARTSEPQARRIDDALVAAGYAVWRDDQLPAHRAYTDVLDERLRAAEAVLVLWSRDGVRSQWVRAEADFARTQDKLVQANLDGSDPPLPFNQIHYARLAGWTGDRGDPEWLKVLASLDALLSSDNARPSAAASEESARRDADPAGRRPRARRWPWAVGAGAAALAVFAAGAGLFLHWDRASRGGGQEPRIALRNLEAPAGDAVAGAFAAALSDEISGALSENQGQSAVRIDDRTAAGRSADLLVGGTVRSEGGALHVRAFLQDPRAHATLWSAEYERPASEGAQLRDEVATDVTDTLYSALDMLRPGHSPDPSSLALYIKAQHALGNQSPLNAKDPQVSLEQLIARQPDFANAHGLLAMVLAGQESPESRQRAREEIRRALAIDPRKAEAAWDGLYYLARHDTPNDLIKIEEPLLKGLAANPNFPFINMRECQLLREVGRAKAAIPFCQRALTLRPLSAPIPWNLARALYEDGQIALAKTVIAKAARAHPTHFRSAQVQLLIEMEAGSPDAALALLDTAGGQPLFLPPQAAEALRSVQAARKSPQSAKVDAALGLVHRAVEAGKLPPEEAVKAPALLGRTEAAFAQLAGPRIRDVSFVIFEPATAPLRRDPRIWPFAVKSGLAAYWRAKGVWPDFCADPALPYDCRVVAAKAAGG